MKLGALEPGGMRLFLFFKGMLDSIGKQFPLDSSGDNLLGND
jgi:hypothetical protein